MKSKASTQRIKPDMKNETRKHKDIARTVAAGSSADTMAVCLISPPVRLVSLLWGYDTGSRLVPVLKPSLSGICPPVRLVPLLRSVRRIIP